jgi:hypothetical protein
MRIGPRYREAVMTWRVLAGMTGVLLCVEAFAQVKPPAAPFEPGEVLVRFADASVADRLAERIGAEAAPLVQMTPHAREIGRAIGVPLEASRVAAGRTVVFTIDRPALIRVIATCLARDADIASAQPAPAKLPTGLNIHLRRRSTNADALATRLSKECGLPLKGRVPGPERLLVEPDLPAITQMAAERIAKHPGVASAQLNYVSDYH